jgi:galactokinase
MRRRPHVPPWIQSWVMQWTVSAPGRVNIIGEHVDYCDGLVLPAAIGLRTWMTGSLRTDDVISVETEAGLRAKFKTGPTQDPGPEKWANYLRGVLAGFLEAGMIVPGLEVRIASTLPQGGGLASSAALTVAFATLLEEVSGYRLGQDRKALICQEAESFAGVPSGCMDQLAAVHARAGHAMLIDCRSRSIEHIPLDGAALIVINTGVKHDLADGEYAARRDETREAARLLGVPSLRDCSPEYLADFTAQLPATLFRRACHVVSEIPRTLACAGALRNGDLAIAGQLMNESHASLRDDFEVSCEELDLVASHAVTIPGVCGCRMTGGGFGGCCVALVRRDAAAEAAESMAEFCRTHLGRGSGNLVAEPGDGARAEN